MFNASRRPRATTAAGAVLVLLSLAALVVLATRADNTPGLEVERRHAPAGIDDLRVEVRGAVASPGVVVAEPGDRVADVIARAGGPLPEADTAQVNLALRVRDQDVITVPARGSGGLLVAQPLIDINTAIQRELESLPGIGPVRAAAIIEARPYATTEDLLARAVIPATVYEQIRSLINAEPPPSVP